MRRAGPGQGGLGRTGLEGLGREKLSFGAGARYRRSESILRRPRPRAHKVHPSSLAGWAARLARLSEAPVVVKRL